MQITTTLSANPTDDARLAEILANPGFGQYFSDHMLTIEWTPEKQWHDARITPYGPITLDPAAAVLHYAQETFEGMKAYRHDDDSLWLFRPEANAARMKRSSQRLALPVLEVPDFVEAVEELVKVDARWVPGNADGGEKSLYIRPFMFASEKFLGVRPAQHVTFMVIASPAGAYFKGGIKPVNLWLTEEYTRAGRGGMGAAKTGGNYASSLVAQQEATAAGCDQVVFLDAQEGKYVEELGGMNTYFVFDDGSIVTPETGTILEGITRASIIELAEKMGHQVTERRFGIDEWREGVTSGRITEIFACGTAAVVTPVGSLKWAGGEVPAPASQDLTMRIREELVGVQLGKVDDTFGWMHRI
ncbi:branched-chain amino acid aminotransferase [Nocardioides sp. zg-536]|uniref:branched-chain-amino-acid transaminase n=1 Tax=Nocardioides faecalis TaxID=2803858 RepID=A0A938Y828_9ACTN|nr:branched-chain amino acid aminotransferase [Nocardioides faecalis]MBM9459216.1 branched-chain amino acid aminotransferase [Nocardioides faecalis]MBS4751464.1 branched-chain amino acid aminotransferase [Nocardioides faecalis]QVI60481.1 branched-chain amino acid aminotransferase [Nocardioides faecalis]